MSERELRDGLALAVAQEPPLSFDPDALVARAKRDMVRRRALAGVGVATALIAIAAVAVPTALRGDGPRQATAATAPARTTTAAPAAEHVWPPARIRVPNLDEGQLRQLGTTWTTELRHALATHMPQVSGVSVQPWGGESEQVQPGQTYLDTFVTFTVHGKPSGMSVQVDAPGSDTTSPEQACAEESDAHCHITWDGPTALVVDPLTTGTGSGAARILSVRQYRADGSVVSATAYNYDPVHGTQRPTSADVPLTVAQLTAVAEDPALSFG